MPTDSARMSFRRHIREQVLRATRELTIEKGWEQVRVSEVAELVGVSRPTLYKEFGDKQGLGDALVVAEGQRFLEGIHAILAEHTGDVQGGITAAVRFTLREAEASPLLKSVLTSSHSGDDRAGAPTTGVLPLLPTSASLLQLLLRGFGRVVSRPLRRSRLRRRRGGRRRSGAAHRESRRPSLRGHRHHGCADLAGGAPLPRRWL